MKMMLLSPLLLWLFFLGKIAAAEEEEVKTCDASEWNGMKETMQSRLDELLSKIEDLEKDNSRLSQELTSSRMSNHQQLMSFESRTFEQQEKIRILQAENSKIHSLLNDNRRNMKQLQFEYSNQIAASTTNCTITNIIFQTMKNFIPMELFLDENTEASNTTSNDNDENDSNGNIFVHVEKPSTIDTSKDTAVNQPITPTTTTTTSPTTPMSSSNTNISNTTITATESMETITEGSPDSSTTTTASPLLKTQSWKQYAAKFVFNTLPIVWKQLSYRLLELPFIHQYLVPWFWRYIHPLYEAYLEDMTHYLLYYGVELFGGGDFWQVLDEWWILFFYRVMDIIRLTGMVDLIGENVIEMILTGCLACVGLVILYVLRYFVAGIVLAICSIFLLPILLLLFILIKCIAWLIPKSSAKATTSTAGKKTTKRKQREEKTANSNAVKEEARQKNEQEKEEKELQQKAGKKLDDKLLMQSPPSFLNQQQQQQRTNLTPLQQQQSTPPTIPAPYPMQQQQQLQQQPTSRTKRDQAIPTSKPPNTSRQPSITISSSTTNATRKPNNNTSAFPSSQEDDDDETDMMNRMLAPPPRIINHSSHKHSSGGGNTPSSADSISPVSSTGMFTPPPLPYKTSKSVITSPFHLSRSLLSSQEE